MTMKGEFFIEQSETTRMQRTKKEKEQDAPSSNRKPSLFFTRIFMIILGLLSLATVSARQTIFNPEYVQQQVSKSQAASTINQQLSGQLKQVGIQQTNLISDDLINKELETMIQQFYDGSQVQLDQNIINDAVNDSVGATGIIRQGITSVVVNQIAGVFNSQLDTQKLNQYSGQISKLKAINQIVMWVSGIGLAILILLAFIRRQGISLVATSMVVVGAFVAIISAIAYISNILGNLPIQYAVVKSIVEQAGQDILIREFVIASVIFVVGVGLMIPTMLLKRKKRLK